MLHSWELESTVHRYSCRNCNDSSTVFSPSQLEKSGCRGARPVKRGRRQVDLYYQDRKSDKEYHIWIQEAGFGQYLVNFSFGKRGGNLLEGTKTPDRAVAFWNAERILHDVVAEKLSKGYDRL